MILTATVLALLLRQNPIDARVEAALQKLPLETKLKVIGGYEGFNIMPIKELGLHKLLMNDGPLGVRGDNESRPSMAYPAGICLASAFDPDLCRQFGQAVGRDAKGRGVSILLGPGVNLSRIVQNGRNFEYLGEDPYLASSSAVPMIWGLQGEGIVATVKHFVANNHENGRLTDSSDVSERALRELYFRPFEAAVKHGNVGAVMCSYNKLNGTYTAEHGWLMQDVLRKEWGFKGVLMSDWGAVQSTLPTALHGVDLEMEGAYGFDPKKLLPLIQSGKIPVSAIDDKVRHILHTIYEFHLDQPLPKAIHDDPRNAVVARKIAEEGIVLLRNRHHALPLNPSAAGSVAVLGYNAMEPVPVGGGSAEIVPLHKESLFDALRRTPLHLKSIPPGNPDVDNALSFKGWKGKMLLASQDPKTGSWKQVDNIQTSFDWTDDHPSPFGMGAFTGGILATFVPKESGAYWLVSRCQGKVNIGIGLSQGVTHTDLTKPTVVKQIAFLTAGIPTKILVRFSHESGHDIHIAFGILRAASPLSEPVNTTVVRRASHVILGVGFNPYLEGEGNDRSFDLPAAHRELLEQVLKLNKHVILIVNSGAGVDLAPYAYRVDAILQCWYAGQEGYKALADILLGKVNPSGKLACTFPKALKGTYYAEAYPPRKGHLQYKEDLLIGYRWFDTKKVEPLYPFGFGLSYSRFIVGKPTVICDGKTLFVSTPLANVGSRKGADVVQIYVGEKRPAGGVPIKELKGYARTVLGPGKSTEVKIAIPVKTFAHWDTAGHRWTVATGDYIAYVGDSSRDTTALRFRVDGGFSYRP